MKGLGWAEIKRRELEGGRKDALALGVALGLAVALWLGFMFYHGLF